MRRGFLAAVLVFAPACGNDFRKSDAVGAMGEEGSGNPLNHSRYTDVEAVAALEGHTSDPSAHHARYTDAEAVDALQDHTSSESAHHSRFTDSEAWFAVARAGLPAGSVTYYNAVSGLSASSAQAAIDLLAARSNDLLTSAEVDSLVEGKGHALAVDTDPVQAEVTAARGGYSSLRDRIADLEARIGVLEAAATERHLYGNVLVSTTSDLDVLVGITHLHGDLIVSGTAVSDVSLPILRYVGGILIENNAGLDTVSMPQLQEVAATNGLGAGYINLNSNPTLTSVDLSSLAFVDDYFVLSLSPLLVSLDMSSLMACGSYFALVALDNLGSVALDALRFLGGRAEFNGLTTLGELMLPSLAHAGGLKIDNVDSILSISAPRLSRFTNDFEVRLNDDLAALLTGFPALAEIGGNYTVESNPLLPTCDAEALRDQVLARDGIGGAVTILGNGSGTCP